MEHKRFKTRINETNSIRSLMGLQPINEKYTITPEEQESMQKISNVMTPQGYSKPGGIGTVPFKNSNEGSNWNPNGPSLSPGRLEYATNQTIKDANVGSWKAEKTSRGIVIKDSQRDFLIVEAPRGCSPNWCYVVRAGTDFPDDNKNENFTQGDYEVLRNYEEYALFLEDILHKHAATPGATPGATPVENPSWCKRFLDVDWYFDKLMVGKEYLKSGDCGDAVGIAQDHMNEYEESEVIKPDNAYGPETIKEVKVVQDELGVKKDGYYGKKTHDVLIRAIGAGKGAPDKVEPKPEEMPTKGAEEISIDLDQEIEVPDDTKDFDYDQDVKGADVEIDTEEFEKKAREKVSNRQKRKNRRGNRKLNRLGNRTKKVKARYDIK
jgi:hypothetical protein